MINQYFPKEWKPYIDPEELESVEAFLEAENKSGRDWHPAPNQVFRALELTKPDTLTALIIGLS